MSVPLSREYFAPHHDNIYIITVYIYVPITYILIR